MRRVVIGALVAFITGGRVGSSAHAQCADWRSQGSGLHFAGSPHAFTTWDPDGPGPSPPLLIAGGFFNRIGGIPANNIAAWNGTAWQALGPGIGTPPVGNTGVLATTVYNGEVVAGGIYQSTGGVTARGIAAWNGTTWRPLDSGAGEWNFTYVTSMTVFNGELVVGGSFDATSGAPGNFIARWNGTSWRPLGSGMNDYVDALTVFNGELIAGGYFTTAGGVSAYSIARWNGTAWRAVSGGMPGNSDIVLSLAVSGTSLVAGGSFTTAGGVPVSSIASWDGAAWYALGAGVGGMFPTVTSLTAFNGDIIAGGTFTSAGGQPASNIAAYHNSAWQSLGSGVSVWNSGQESVYALHAFGSELIVGGSFVNAGGIGAACLARWNGAAWLSLPGPTVPTIDQVHAFTTWAGSLVMGGYFTTTETNVPRISNNLVSWNGTGFLEMGNPNDIVNGVTTAPGAFNSTDLIAAGNFTSIGGVTANRIARVNDTLGPGWQPMGNGFNAQVNATALFNANIYAAGAFTASGATALNRIARWNGTSWQPVGPGPVTGVNGTVHALKVFSPISTTVNLVVGGQFASAGGLASPNIATYSQGTLTGQESWNAMGQGLNGPVYAIERFAGSTYAAGNFTASGATPLHNIARWNGTAWVDVGGGTNDEIRAMTVSNGTLVIGGAFTMAGGSSVQRLARWNGTSWSAVSGGPDYAVMALGTFRNELQVGGQFWNIGSPPTESPLWARFSEDGVPWIARQPLSQSANCGSDVTLSVTPAAGYPALAFAWRKGGTPLSGGPTGTGSTIVPNGGNLTIQHASPADAGAYDCVISNTCGSITSNAANVSVNPCQPCDVNCDGIVNPADAAALVNLLLSPATIPCSGAAGDMNMDGVRDALDIQLFVGCLIP